MVTCCLIGKPQFGVHFVNSFTDLLIITHTDRLIKQPDYNDITFLEHEDDFPGDTVDSLFQIVNDFADPLQSGYLS